MYTKRSTGMVVHGKGKMGCVVGVNGCQSSASIEIERHHKSLWEQTEGQQEDISQLGTYMSKCHVWGGRQRGHACMPQKGAARWGKKKQWEGGTCHARVCHVMLGRHLAVLAVQPHGRHRWGVQVQ